MASSTDMTRNSPNSSSSPFVTAYRESSEDGGKVTPKNWTEICLSSSDLFTNPVERLTSQPENLQSILDWSITPAKLISEVMSELSQSSALAIEKKTHEYRSIQDAAEISNLLYFRTYVDHLGASAESMLERHKSETTSGIRPVYDDDLRVKVASLLKWKDLVTDSDEEFAFNKSNERIEINAHESILAMLSFYSRADILQAAVEKLSAVAQQEYWSEGATRFPLPVFEPRVINFSEPNLENLQDKSRLVYPGNRIIEATEAGAIIRYFLQTDRSTTGPQIDSEYVGALIASTQQLLKLEDDILGTATNLFGEAVLASYMARLNGTEWLDPPFEIKEGKLWEDACTLSQLVYSCEKHPLFVYTATFYHLTSYLQSSYSLYSNTFPEILPDEVDESVRTRAINLGVMVVRAMSAVEFLESSGCSDDDVIIDQPVWSQPWAFLQVEREGKELFANELSLVSSVVLEFLRSARLTVAQYKLGQQILENGIVALVGDDTRRDVELAVLATKPYGNTFAACDEGICEFLASYNHPLPDITSRDFHLDGKLIISFGSNSGSSDDVDNRVDGLDSKQ